jgi:LPS-assembly protein
MNRFTGVDRISNANQVSLGMTSRITDPYTGSDIVHGELGEILYLQKRKVCLDKPCDQVKGTSRAVSPLIGRVKYNITDNLTTSGNIAWQPRTNDVDNASWQLSYKGKRNRIIDIGYNFIDQDDDFPGAPAGDPRNDFSRLNAGASWPIYGNWHALGHIYYNLSHSWLQNYFYGVEYSGCCWSMRIMSSKNLIAVDNNNMPNYDRDIFFQIKFKGLAGFETKDPHYLLDKGLGGYTDVFGDD